MSPEEIKREMRLKRNRRLEQDQELKKRPINWIWIRLLLTVLLTLGILIGTKKSTQFKKQFYEQVYETNFSFAYINGIYKNLFGSPIPFSEFLKEPVKPTFKEKLVYQKSEPYQDGVKLIVDNGYLVPIKDSGLVVFIGEKEGYGKTVIIQQMNGIDLWYGGLKEVNVKLYDYVEEGSLLGEIEKQELFLVFKKEGTILDYKEYL